jgi:hypothetical protein
MFVLGFYRTVSNILDWKEAPPTKVLNQSMSRAEQNKMPPEPPIYSESEMLLRDYISTEYPAYFGFALRWGAKTDSHYHKILNAPSFGAHGGTH